MSSLYVKTLVGHMTEPRTLAMLVHLTGYSRKLLLATMWEARVLGLDIVAVPHPGEDTKFELKGTTR